jgi:polar amino acid transport system substrate-binding protein
MTEPSTIAAGFASSLKKAGTGLALLCVSGAAYAQGMTPTVPATNALPEIEFGFPEQPPRTFTNAQGQPDGQAIRMAAALFAKAGIAWHASSYPAPRLFKNLDDGTTTFAVMVHNPALDNCCLINKNSIYSTELKVYYIGEKEPIKNRHGLSGKHIITIRGYSYSGLIGFINDPGNRIVNEVASTHDAAFDMLLAGRADYVLNYDSSASVILGKRPIVNLRNDTIDRVETHIVLSKSYPNAKKVMARLEVILKAIDAPEFFKAPAK